MPIPSSLTLTTAQQLFDQGSDGYRYELVAGELAMMSPAGGRHGRIAIQVAYLLKKHVDENQLGTVYAAETGFMIAEDPDTVLAPDVAFLSAERQKSIENELGYIPMAPDLAVEVLSPSDRYSKVEAKAMAWLDVGSKLVLVVDPERQTVGAYYSRKQVQIFDVRETVDCGVAVANWHLVVQEIFNK